MAVLLIGWSLVTIGENVLYDSGGVAVRGTVTAKSVENIPAAGSDAEPDYVIGYRFTTVGQSVSEIDGRDIVPRELFNRLESGMLVDVEYIKSDVDRNRLTQARSRTGKLFVLSVVSFLAATGGAFLARRGYAAGREIAYLEHYGAVHVARVIGIEDAGLRTDNDRLFHLVYEYPGPSGEPIQGRSDPGTRKSFRGVDLGDEIRIRVDLENPESSAWEADIAF